jgi:hypothetical protein
VGVVKGYENIIDIIYSLPAVTFMKKRWFPGIRKTSFFLYINHDSNAKIVIFAFEFRSFVLFNYNSLWIKE